MSEKRVCEKCKWNYCDDGECYSNPEKVKVVPFMKADGRVGLRTIDREKHWNNRNGDCPNYIPYYIPLKWWHRLGLGEK